jgi:hypothetical protein
MKKFSYIKGRIREFADCQGINIKEIYKNTGMTDGTLSNLSGITEDNILKFFSHYKNVNANWLFKGEGNMIQFEGRMVSEPHHQYSPSDNQEYIIDIQKKMIKQLEQKIDFIEKELNQLKK